jgi:hypothetical protein
VPAEEVVNMYETLPALLLRYATTLAEVLLLRSAQVAMNMYETLPEMLYEQKEKKEKKDV